MASPFNPDLLDDFNCNRVALFLGAGVSASAKTKSGNSIRTWEKFLKDTASSIKNKTIRNEIIELVTQGDYLFACELIKNELQEKWESVLKREYEKIGSQSPLQKAILDLKSRIIITSNFDLFLENQWEKSNPSATHHFQVKNGISPECFSIFRDESPHLIKLHGSINNFESIIFSLSDYAKKAHANWQYSSFIETLLCTHTVIFIGFSMKDTAITNLLEIHAQKYPKNRPHYAFLPDFKSDRKIQIMKNHRKLFIIDYSSNDNHKELVTKLRSLKSEVEKRHKLKNVS